MDNSIVEYFTDHSGHRCGYCKGTDTNFSRGMWAHRLTCEDYQALIDRNWRRSGKYCYKPTMEQLCCPMYMIRCDAVAFKPSKSQKKVLKRVHRYLATGVVEKGAGGETERAEGGVTEEMKTATPSATDVSVKGEVRGQDYPAPLAPPTSSTASAGDGGQGTSVAQPSDTAVSQKVGKAAESSDGPDKKAEGRGQQRKKREMRRERWRQKVIKRGLDPEAVQKKATPEKSLEDYLNAPLPDQPAHTLEVRMVSTSGGGRDDEFARTRQESYLVYCGYQMKIHGDGEADCDEDAYRGFLVDSPLKAAPMAGVSEVGHGTYHCQYLLDGKVVAVEVMDILTNCISSKYLYYDTDYSFLSLGTYSALWAISFVRRLQQKNPALRHYLMGYYIHSCPKMKYKGSYHGSQLLCPETYEWTPIERCLPRLDANKYSRFADHDKGDPDAVTKLDDLLVLHEHLALPYSVYLGRTQAEDQDEVRQYAKLVGEPLSQRMLLYRS